MMEFHVLINIADRRPARKPYHGELLAFGVGAILSRRIVPGFVGRPMDGAIGSPALQLAQLGVPGMAQSLRYQL